MPNNHRRNNIACKDHAFDLPVVAGSYTGIRGDLRFSDRRWMPAIESLHALGTDASSRPSSTLRTGSADRVTKILTRVTYE